MLIYRHSLERCINNRGHEQEDYKTCLDLYQTELLMQLEYNIYVLIIVRIVDVLSSS
jgi:hypothetical protein